VWILICHLAVNVWVGLLDSVLWRGRGDKQSACVTVRTAKSDYYHMVLTKHWGGSPNSSEFYYMIKSTQLTENFSVAKERKMKEG